jgi:uncharacterized membrane protein
MYSLAAAAIFFVGIHLLISGTGLRTALIARMGTPVYLGLFSLLSAVGLTWLIIAFIQAGEPQFTAAHSWRWLAALANLLALVLIAFGVMGRSPTGVGGAAQLEQPEPARGMHRVTRHPMLWGFALWATTHMLFNPQPAPLLFFGAFLALALLGPRSIDAKRARALGEPWRRYEAVTSNVPFAAIATGRNRWVTRELLTPPLWVGLAAWVLLLVLHGRLFGVPAL